MLRSLSLPPISWLTDNNMAHPVSTNPSTQDNMICNHCRNPQYHKRYYCRSILKIKNAASLGCPICSLLLIAIKSVIPNLYATDDWQYDFIQCMAMENKDIFGKFCYIKFNPGKGIQTKLHEIELFSTSESIVSDERDCWPVVLR